jgi:lysophospholipase L1-like esterase
MKAAKRGLAPFLSLLLGTTPALAQQQDTTASRWESDIRAFERADSARLPPEGAILFVGSSSIRLWTTLQRDFPGYPVINRGFGGSELSDAVHFADRIVVRYQPREVVVYAGDNDIADGKQPEQILANYEQLVSIVHQQLPRAKIAYISIKPSLARWRLVEQIRTTNRLIRDYSSRDPLLSYIDVFTPMLARDGTPRKELFAPDGLHLNAEGYALWTEIVRPYLR